MNLLYAMSVLVDVLLTAAPVHAYRMILNQDARRHKIEDFLKAVVVSLVWQWELSTPLQGL